jgi:hypothetical protein
MPLWRHVPELDRQWRLSGRRAPASCPGENPPGGCPGAERAAPCSALDVLPPAATSAGSWSAPEPACEPQLVWPHPSRAMNSGCFDVLRASPGVGCVVDPWWTCERSIRRAARSPFPLCPWKSGVSTTARQSGLRLDKFRRPRETAVPSGTGIAPGGFEPPTSRFLSRAPPYKGRAQTGTGSREISPKRPAPLGHA